MSYKLFAQRVSLVGVTSAIINLRGLILIPILTKSLGADAFGVWSQILVTVSLLAPLCTLGLGYAITRFLASEKDRHVVSRHVSSIFLTTSLISLILSVLLFLFSESLAGAVFGGTEAAVYIKISSILILLAAIDQIMVEYFTGFQQIKRYSAFMISQTACEIVLITYFVLSGYGLSGAIISLIIARASTTVIAALWIGKDIGISAPHPSDVRSYLPYTLPLLPTALSYWFVNLGDRYVIGYFMGAEAVGIYSASYGIGAILALFYAPLSGTLFPAMVKCYENDDILGLKTYIEYSLKFFLMFAIPSLFGLTILSGSLLMTLTTSEFVGGGAIISVVALANLLYYSSFINTHILNMFKETKLVGALFGASAIINLILNIILVPIMGIMGAAIATLATFIFHAFMIGRISFKKMHYKIDINFIAKSVVSSVIMALVVWRLDPVGSVEILISVGVGSAVYFFCMIGLKGFSKKEINFLRDSLS
jgi:O-antigen/teichoic acid export membrane protein